MPTGYVPIAISAQPFAGNAYTAEYKRPVSVTYPIAPTVIGLDHVSNADHWILDCTGTSAAVDITLYWTNESSSGGSPTYITDLASLAIAHSNGSSWDSYGGVSLATGNLIAGAITWPAVTAFGPFSLASINFGNPLPVAIDHFNGTRQNGQHLLEWKISCGSNDIITVTLERSSDNKNFMSLSSSTVTFLESQQPFACTDQWPLTGLNYYRLKIVDANGKITYSRVAVMLHKKDGFDIAAVFPTVVHHNAVVHIMATQKTTVQVIITDIAGRQLQKIPASLVIGNNQFKLNLQQLSPGIYQIMVCSANHEKKLVRFVKQ
jgi:hypothetical protein